MNKNTLLLYPTKRCYCGDGVWVEGGYLFHLVRLHRSVCLSGEVFVLISMNEIIIVTIHTNQHKNFTADN